MIPTPTRATATRFYKPERLEWLRVIRRTEGRGSPLSKDQMTSFLYSDFLRRANYFTRPR